MNYTYYRRYQQPKRGRRRPKRGSFASFFWFSTFLVVLVLLARACVQISGNIAEEKRDEATLIVDQGLVDVTLWGQSKSELASSSQIIFAGDTVQTREGSLATLSFYNGTRLVLDENTRLIFDSFEVDGADDQVHLDLVQGRVYVFNVPNERGVMELTLSGDIMDALSFSGEYLMSHNLAEESVFALKGSVQMKFLDRNSPEELLVEEINLSSGQKSTFDSAKEKTFLARQTVILSESFGDELETDDFYLWNTQGISFPAQLELEQPEEPEPVEIEEPEEVEPVEEVKAPVQLSIVIDSPSSGTTILKDAIAIEGRVTAGQASRIEVTWSGDGDPYSLGLFEEGDETFRYVADAAYENFALGENSYTITAYDSEGNASNSVVVTLNAEF